MNWHVYLLRCADGAYYCGITVDIARRLRQHNGELAGGARFTSGRRPVTLLAQSGALSRSEALGLEARIKKLPAAKKLACLAGFA